MFCDKLLKKEVIAMNGENTNWSQSVAGVLIEEGKVLLARHTYGGGKGKLIIPGGYLEKGEMPEEALAREFKEEVGLSVKTENLLGIRFNRKDWYAVFSVKYVGGELRADRDEISEAVWIPVEEALLREDVPDLTKKLIQCARDASNAFGPIDYNGLNPPYQLYGQKK